MAEKPRRPCAPGVCGANESWHDRRMKKPRPGLVMERTAANDVTEKRAGGR